jgi:hypothetical protein
MPPLPSSLPPRRRRPLPLTGRPPPSVFPSPLPSLPRRRVAPVAAAGRTCLAYSDDDDASDDDAHLADLWRHRAAVAKLRRMVVGGPGGGDRASKTKVSSPDRGPSGRLTGPELRALVRRRFGRSHLCAIKRHGRAYVLEVSGRALEDVVGCVMPTEAAYAQNLDVLAAQIAFWEMDDYVREALAPLGAAAAGATTTTYAAAAPPTTRFAGLIDCPLLIYLRLIPQRGDPQALIP